MCTICVAIRQYFLRQFFILSFTPAYFSSISNPAQTISHGQPSTIGLVDSFIHRVLLLALGIIMFLFDSYVVYLMVFSPLLAAIFITLIPTPDINSKRSISRFFALIGFIAFIRVFILFLNKNLLEQYAISFNLIQFYVNFSINIDKYNIFLFGISSVALLANMLLYELNDTKSNIHQVAPFVLTFILFITFGQRDLRVALPIISIANFIIYYLIGYSNKIRRGSTIFHMGTFLFTFDTLALILLQYQTESHDFLKLIILIPGFARLTLPVFAPFMKNLFLNLDESEGPFIITFLQLTGFFILVLFRAEFSALSEFILDASQVIIFISALYIAFLALSEHRTLITPYYFLVLYASLTACLIFLDKFYSLWYLSYSLLMSNIICFLHNIKTSLMINQYQHINSLQNRVRATWFLSLCLIAGVPGFGIGAALWQIIYNIINYKLMNITLGLCFIAVWLLLEYALIISMRKENFTRDEANVTIVDYRVPITKTFVIAPFFVALITFLIPIITYYTYKRV